MSLVHDQTFATLQQLLYVRVWACSKAAAKAPNSMGSGVTARATITATTGSNGEVGMGWRTLKKSASSGSYNSSSYSTTATTTNAATTTTYCWAGAVSTKFGFSRFTTQENIGLLQGQLAVCLECPGKFL